MLKIRSLYILFFILIKINFQLKSQSIVSPQSFLASARNENAVNLQNAKIDFITKADYKIPIIENYSFRTETNRFNLKRQEYWGRVNFNGFKEIKNQKLVQQAKAEVEDAGKGVILEDALLDRYGVLVDFRHYNNSIAANSQLLEVYKDKVTVTRTMAKMSTDFDIYQLVKAEEEYYDLQQKLAKDISDKAVVISYVKNILRINDSISIDTANWLPLSKIRDFTFGTDTNLIQSPFEKRQLANINLWQSAYNLEKAKAQRILDFAQIQYSSKPNDVIRNEIAVGFGVLLPYRGSSKVDLNEINIKKLEESQDLNNWQYMRARSLAVLKQDIAGIFEQYDLIKQQISESQTQYALDEYAKIQGSKPLALLRMKEIVLKRKAELIDLEHSIYQKYIKLLTLMGKITEPPLKNYLSESLNQF